MKTQAISKTTSAPLRVFAAGALACLLGLGVTPSQANDLAKIKADKVIRVAIDLGAPPFGKKDETLKPIGSDVETAELLATDLGVKLVIVPTKGANRVTFLLPNKADMVVEIFSLPPEITHGENGKYACSERGCL